MILELGSYRLKIDVEKTKKANALIMTTNRECTCNVCQHFTPAIQQTSKSVLDFFAQLGLDPKRPSEVMEFEIKKGIMDCCGYYHIVGEILEISRPEWIYESLKSKRRNPANVIEISDSFYVSFSNDCDLVPSDFPTPVFQMEIYCKLPWLLDYIPDQEMPKKMTQKLNINFAKLVDKKTIRKLGTTKQIMVFEVDSKIIELITEEVIFDGNELGWFGIIGYRANNLLYIHNIKEK
jgi:hypothetical protein